MEVVITDQNFEEVINSAPKVLVDFWAVWCGPCRMLAPTVEEVASEVDPSAVVVAKCNVDDCEEVSMKCGIRNIPTLLYFKDGQLVDRTVGVVSKAEILSKINSL